MNDLERLAALIRDRNSIERSIASITGRPALTGHTGEYIAANIFDIQLVESASEKGIDGHFMSGSLAGRSVNIKWYTVRQNLLDLTLESPPDYYLVMTGAKAGALSCRGQVYPATVSSVFLFEWKTLLAALQERQVKLGVATSVAEYLWTGAEIYPEQRNCILVLTSTQHEQLELFA